MKPGWDAGSDLGKVFDHLLERETEKLAALRDEWGVGERSEEGKWERKLFCFGSAQARLRGLQC